MDIGEEIQRFSDHALSRMRFVDRLIGTRSSDYDALDASFAELDYLKRFTNNAIDNVEHPSAVVLAQIRDAIERQMVNLAALYNVNEVGEEAHCYPAVARESGKFVISYEILYTLRGEGFTIPQIACFLGVSQRTIERRLETYSLTHSYSTVTDDHLDDLTRAVLAQFPRSGYRFVQALLKSEGYSLQRHRVRSSMARMDPFGVARRFFRFIPRRRYSVAGPNALWHLDGNHKLVTWGFYVHGLIDGYSRVVLSMICATNNASSTVFKAFLNAAALHGVPSRLRCDKGGENVLVGRWMEQMMGEGRGSCLMGRSVHNQRIERLWVDLRVLVLEKYRDLFGEMEQAGILNLETRLHIIALHLVYLPRIQRDLNGFIEMYNNHKLRTEKSMTPRQVFLKGTMENKVKGVKPHDLVINPHSREMEQCRVCLARLAERIEVPDSMVSDHVLVNYITEEFDLFTDDGTNGLERYVAVVRSLYELPRVGGVRE